MKSLNINNPSIFLCDFFVFFFSRTSKNVYVGIFLFICFLDIFRFFSVVTVRDWIEFGCDLIFAQEITSIFFHFSSVIITITRWIIYVIQIRVVYSLQNKHKSISVNKVGCVFSLVISSEFRMGKYREDDHREDALHFTKLTLVITSVFVIQGCFRHWAAVARRAGSGCNIGNKNWLKPSAAISSHSYFSTRTFFYGHGFSFEMRLRVPSFLKKS